MGTLTIRNLDEDLKQRLRERAARHGVDGAGGKKSAAQGSGAHLQRCRGFRYGGGDPRIRPGAAKSRF
ncbi:FitA-like ribbon-helix-helix domain-containing protein [Mesorhizobium sp. BR1-1-12]|uniref:FitA-like ribbon-helix-helix domain-containing protein n=1 Tax=unclassified Mesorhizobium TaxID=325217 RepID=UPI00398C98A0